MNQTNQKALATCKIKYSPINSINSPDLLFYREILNYFCTIMCNFLSKKYFKNLDNILTLDEEHISNNEIELSIVFKNNIINLNKANNRDIADMIISAISILNIELEFETSSYELIENDGFTVNHEINLNLISNKKEIAINYSNILTTLMANEIQFIVYCLYQHNPDNYIEVTIDNRTTTIPAINNNKAPKYVRNHVKFKKYRALIYSKKFSDKKTIYYAVFKRTTRHFQLRPKDDDISNLLKKCQDETIYNIHFFYLNMMLRGVVSNTDEIYLIDIKFHEENGQLLLNY